jgi:hypothetical protein
LKNTKYPAGEQTPGSAVGLSTGNAVVDAIGQMHFEGNIVDHRWFLSPLLRHKNGLVNGTAIWVLSDVVFWHRPELLRDRGTNVITGAKKKFDDDEFWQDYKVWSLSLGLTERQVRDAIAFLHNAGIITRRTEPVTLRSGHRTNNVAIITIVPEVLHEITYAQASPRKKQRGTPHVVAGGLSRSNATRPTPQRDSISTKSTTETTHKSTTARRASDDDDLQNLIDALIAQKVTPTRAQHLAQNFPAEMWRRLQYLPHVQILTTPAQYLSGKPDEEYSQPPALAKARAAELAELQAAADARAAAIRRAADEQRAREMLDRDDQLDSHYKSLDEIDRADVDERARQHLARVMNETRDTPAALAIARRAVIRKELGIATEEEPTDEEP